MKKTIWLTGGSSGLGLAVAKAFQQEGWTVITGARSFDADMTCEDGIYRCQLDVTDEASCRAFAERAYGISARVDILACAAAILNLGSCEMTTPEEYRAVMDTNFLGMTRMVSLALPYMRAQGEGRILLFSSINGLLGIPFQSAYTASKHAIEGYAECLNMEVGQYGIRVTLVEPGDHSGGSQRTRLHAARETADSPYCSAYEQSCAAIARDEAGGLPPERLGKIVVRAMQRKRSPFRLIIAKPDQRLAVVMHKLLPADWNKAFIRSYYFKENPKK